MQTLGFNEARCLEPRSEIARGERTDTVESLPDSRPDVRDRGITTPKHRQGEAATALEDAPYLAQRPSDVRKEMQRPTAIDRIEEFLTEGQFRCIAADEGQVIESR